MIIDSSQSKMNAHRRQLFSAFVLKKILVNIKMFFIIIGSACGKGSLDSNTAWSQALSFVAIFRLTLILMKSLLGILGNYSDRSQIIQRNIRM